MEQSFEEQLRAMTNDDLFNFLNMYHNATEQLKGSIRYYDYFNEHRRRNTITITRAELLKALNEVDRMDDDLNLVLLSPKELMRLLFKD